MKKKLKHNIRKIHTSDWIFDSRPPDFKNVPNGDFNISQSFFGLKVELKEKELDQSIYHMMDFRISQENLLSLYIYHIPQIQH